MVLKYESPSNAMDKKTFLSPMFYASLLMSLLITVEFTETKKFFLMTFILRSLLVFDFRLRSKIDFSNAFNCLLWQEYNTAFALEFKCIKKKHRKNKKP